uniref:Putative adenylate cyclase regulatory protein n=1 Tax=Rhizophora mucronata TaxID=61149 RepID=A0A2P2KD70_RHIMU
MFYTYLCLVPRKHIKEKSVQTNKLAAPHPGIMLKKVYITFLFNT